MSTAVQKIGINIGGSSTDQVNFSTLRDTFFQTDPNTAYSGSSTIRASDLLRTTTLPSNGGSQTNPLVPDATENSNILTSLGNNWRVSHFQQSVKWYNIVQSGTDLNYSIGGQSWNSNLTKNVVKRMKVTGTLGSNSTSTSATFSGSAYNLRIEVSGNIYGYGGKGGGTDVNFPISGESGGTALSVTSGGTGLVVIDVSGNIYGGGGGGERGVDGTNGSGGTCYYTQTFNSGCQEGALTGCGNLLAGSYQIGSSNRCCQENRGCSANIWYRTCQVQTSTSGGTKGIGGNGGNGRGYNNQSNSLTGGSGTAGTSGQSCPSGYSSSPGATSGTDGTPGGAGGNWGSAGGNTTNTGNGGSAGSAITGSDYSITGTTTNIIGSK